jgi:hypothetical protein
LHSCERAALWKSGPLGPRQSAYVSGALAPEIRKASDSSEALHHLSFVILSDARRSVAPERESKDLCTLAFPTLASGHPHRALYDRTSCRVQASGNLLPPTLFICHPERSEALTSCSFTLLIPSALV